MMHYSFPGPSLRRVLASLLLGLLAACGGGSDSSPPDGPDPQIQQTPNDPGSSDPGEPEPADPEPADPEPADPSVNLDPVDPEPPPAQPAANGSSSLVAQPLTVSVEEDQTLSLPLAANLVTGASYALFRQAYFGQVDITRDGQFSYVPAADFYGKDSFEFYIWDKQGGSLPATVSIDVLAVADPPVIAGNPALLVKQGEHYRARFTASDPDVEALSFQASDLPVWLTLDADSGVLTGVPLQIDVGIHQVLISVVDESGTFTAFPEFSIEVLDVNDPPRLNFSEFPIALDARQEITVDLSPDDIDGDAVEISSRKNNLVEVEIQGGSVKLTAADVQQVTQTELEITARDSHGGSTRQRMPLTLYPLNATGTARTVLGRVQGAGIHIVIVGDGYQQHESSQYREHVGNLIELMLDDPAIATHISALNIHALETPSRDSGVDDQFGSDLRDTAFDAGYFCNGIERLICADELKMFDTALAEFPFLDQLILLANDRRFGGSGGSVAIASAFYPEIAIHEMGHSIAGLADEYVDSSIELPSGYALVEGQYPNVSTLNDPTRVPWAHWIDNVNNYPTQTGQPGVGIFEGAYYRASALFRPTSNSRMRSNIEHFGPVNGEQWVLSLYRSLGAVLDFGPVLRRLELNAGEEVRFYIETLFDESLQTIEWILNDKPLAAKTWQSAITLTPPAGQHRLEVRVSDISGLVRSPKINPSIFSWHWELSVQ